MVAFLIIYLVCVVVVVIYAINKRMRDKNRQEENGTRQPQGQSQAQPQGQSQAQPQSRPQGQQKGFQPTNEPGVLYAVQGVRGRYLRVYDDRCVINVKAGIGSFFTGNVTDGEKTIYYVDCVGVQFKEAKFAIGYLQLETASSAGNNRNDNFFNENSFTFDVSTISNENMRIVADFVKRKVAEAKQAMRGGGTVVAALSPAEELKKYKELLDAGIITPEEFDAKKRELLKI